MRQRDKCGLAALVLLAGLCLWLTTQPEYRPALAFYPHTPAPQPWRWLSAHLLHLNATHLWLNLLAAAVLTLLAWQRQKLALLLPVLLLSALAVDLGLLLETPVNWYVGLSGALHGMFAWLVLDQGLAAPRRDWPWLLSWLLGAIKIRYDLHSQTQWLGIVSVPQAHLYGFIGGTLLALLCYLRRQR